MSIPAHSDSEQSQSSSLEEQDISEIFDTTYLLNNPDLPIDIKPIMPEEAGKSKSVAAMTPVNQMATSNQTFAMLLKAVPIKLDAITKLNAVGSNFDIWEADIIDYLTFIPAATDYLKPGALPSLKGWVADMANGVNSVIHWTIDRQLGMRIRKMSVYPSVRMEELRRLFSGVSYANRLSLLSQLTSSKYDPGASTVDSYFSQMANLRDRLEISGMPVSDDVYAGILALGVPNDFPDIAHTFEAALITQPKARVSASDVMRAISAGDVSYKRNHPGSTDAMKATVHEGKKDSKGATCHYCQKTGHYARDCRKKAKDRKEKKVETEVSEAKEAEIEDVDIGYSACVLQIKVEISQMETDIAIFLAVFDTGATHHVFNNKKYFINLKIIQPIPVKMANGSTSSFITGIGDVAIRSHSMQCTVKVLKRVFLCETLRHSLISGIALAEDGGRFCSNGKDVDLIFSSGERIRAERNGRRWVVESVIANVTTAAVLGDYMLWHRRLGHPNERVLKNMIRDSSCVGLPEKLTKTIPSEDCVD